MNIDLYPFLLGLLVAAWATLLVWLGYQTWSYFADGDWWFLAWLYVTILVLVTPPFYYAFG